MASRIATAGTFALGLLAGSLVIEAGLRAIEATPLWRVLPVADASLYGPDEATGYAHRPGARGIRTPENRVLVEINSLGLRDRLDRTRSKPAGAVRWAVAGDSVTEAQQVPLEQSFAYLAEEDLSARAGPDVEVVNLGLAGARPAVIVERLRSRAKGLNLDGLVVLVSAGELLSPSEDDPSEYAGYVAGPDGKAVISHAFREGRGYQMRRGPIGAAIYLAVENSRLALLLNNRKNAGLLAELAAAPPPRPAASPCADSLLAALETLYGPSPRGFSGARLEAFLADLADIGRDLGIGVTVAMRGLTTQCSALDQRAGNLSVLIAKRVNAAGLRFSDADREVINNLAMKESLADLTGFRARIGIGHLNAAGHRAYARVLAGLVWAANNRREPR